MEDVKISEIIVGERARIESGWIQLDSLERSIEHYGVLQPIGITKDKKLIFGGRRLEACKKLGLETIPARIFDIDADNPVEALLMEQTENNQRADLSPGEKTALAMRIEEALARRQGRPPLETVEEIIPQIFGELPKGKERESSALAAKAVGMNRETYRQAKAVIKSGNQDEIQAMDTGEKSINAAYNAVKKSPKTKTFSVTLYKNPKDDAETLLVKGGHDYCTKLALALLEAAGHKVDLGMEGKQ